MHPIIKRKAPTDDSTEHDTQVSKKQRNEKTQGQVADVDRAIDWSSSSSWMRSFNYNRRYQNTNRANDWSSSSSWTRSFRYNSGNPNRMRRTFLRDPATGSTFTLLSSPSYNALKMETKWQPAKPDRKGMTVVHIESSHDTTSTTLISTVVSSTSVKSSTASVGVRPRSHDNKGDMPVSKRGRPQNVPMKIMEYLKVYIKRGVFKSAEKYFVHLTTEEATLPVKPTQSPDLNPVEHMWGGLRSIQRILVEWYKIPVSFYRKLISSMHSRLWAVDNAKVKNSQDQDDDAEPTTAWGNIEVAREGFVLGTMKKPLLYEQRPLEKLLLRLLPSTE
ncbi:hypothetical protein BX616_001246 [Lobosporangium transversale]|nr:hypothetical protein BX616_001246 [Lobosporangium transversale]